MKQGARRGTGRSWMRSLGAVGAATAVAVVLAFSSAAPASAAFQGDVSEQLSAKLSESLSALKGQKKPDPKGPKPAQTPELGSLLLFGSGAAGMAGYAVTRLRHRRPGGK
ncbi:MAG TPA: hypothetical protein VH257_08800 [Chloroflexota bacterium]|nr:hypothetical protein [Chloroflexota bacterium]